LVAKFLRPWLRADFRLNGDFIYLIVAMIKPASDTTNSSPSHCHLGFSPVLAKNEWTEAVFNGFTQDCKPLKTAEEVSDCSIHLLKPRC
jgi:hypothetical protein